MSAARSLSWPILAIRSRKPAPLAAAKVGRIEKPLGVVVCRPAPRSSDGAGPALVRVNPADAERVPGRVGVNLVVICGLEHLSAQCRHFVVGRFGVIYPQVKVNLLGWCSVRPVGPDVVRRELDAHTGLTVDHDHVPLVFRGDGAAEHPSPECALGRKIVRIKGHNLPLNPHGWTSSHTPEPSDRHTPWSCPMPAQMAVRLDIRAGRGVIAGGSVNRRSSLGSDGNGELSLCTAA